MENPENSSVSSDCRGELADQIAMLLKVPDAKPLILGVLADFDVTRKKTELIVYDGGETDYLIKRFLIAKKVQGCTDRTCKTYSETLVRAFGTMAKSPTAVTHTDVQAMLAKLIVKGTSKAYQSLHQRTLNSFYNWMEREELIQKNPMKKVDTVKVKAPKRKAFTDMEVEQLRCACRTNRERALIEVLLSTGCRIFEVSEITIEQVQHESFEIIGKGEKPRTVYLNAKATLAIGNYLRERKDNNPYLFPASCITGSGGKALSTMFHGDAEWYKKKSLVHETEHMNPDTLRGVIHTIGRLAGVEDCYPHKFRRTCATMALRRGMGVLQVQQMLGHDQLTTTQRYLDVESDELREAHKKYVL